MANYICLTPCFFQKTLFQKGDLLTTEREVPPYFKELKEEDNVEEITKKVKAGKVNADNIEALHKQYFEKFKKKVPNNMKNNIDWLTLKLAD
jgi:hypothetical protein